MRHGYSVPVTAHEHRIVAEDTDPIFGKTLTRAVGIFFVLLSLALEVVAGVLYYR